MNVVYWFTFETRLKNKTPPYFYIGSKHNCAFENGVIIDLKYTSRREYWSSCEQADFLEAIQLEKPTVKILDVCEDVLDEEEWYHSHYNIPKSPLFFNKATARGAFGGAGERAPRYGMKNSPATRRAISLALSDVPLTESHKQAVSDGLQSFCATADTLTNSRGNVVIKTWSDGAKKRHQNPNNVHPRGMAGKQLPRFICEFCGFETSINYKSRHIKKCVEANKFASTKV